MATLCPMLKFREFDANGLPLVGGKVYFWASGTTDAQDVYADPNGTVPLEYPVILDSSGQRTVYLNGIYDGKVTDADGNLMYTFEYALGGLNTSGGASAVLIPSYTTVGTGQEDIGTLSSYEWGDGSISPTATSFNIGITRASVTFTGSDYNEYYNDTIAVPGTDTDPVSGKLFNFGNTDVGIVMVGASIDSNHTLFGNDTVHMTGMVDNTPPYNGNDLVRLSTNVTNEFDINTTTSAFTFRIWINFDTLPVYSVGGSTGVRVFTDGLLSDNSFNWTISVTEISESSGTYKIGFGIGNGNSNTVVDSANAQLTGLTTGVWTRLKVTRDADGITRFYQDNTELGSGESVVGATGYNQDAFKFIGSRAKNYSGQEDTYQVLDGSWAYFDFFKGVALTDPEDLEAPPVYNQNGGSFALRIIGDSDELDSTIYSGFGTNILPTDWGVQFSPDVTANTYIGICDNLESEADFFTGNVKISKGVNDGEGLYTWNVEVDGHIENPLLDSKKQVSSTGYFQTDEAPIGFKLYTNSEEVDFNSGIASLSQYATTYGITGMNNGPFSNHYSSTGTNTYTLTKMDDAQRPSEYFNGLEFNFTPANTNDSTDVNVIILDSEGASLGTMDILMPDGNPPPIGFCANDVCLFCHYDDILEAGIIDSPSVLNATMIPDDIIDTDMIADDAVTSDKIDDDAVTTDKILDDAVTLAKIADDSVDTDQIVDEAVTEDKLSTGVVGRLPFAWCCFDGTATGTNAPANGYNVTDVERVSAGKYTINFTSTAGDTNYAVLATCVSGDKAIGTNTRAVGSVQVWVRDDSGNTYQDSSWVSVLVYS